ncbi:MULTISPECIES: chain length determinant protein tyrosine kinase EpsG [unclassified Duganella]|uniref:chain length determinant protein tyrosine kinase EpsG n=1 Tax=unclassified Duganella TaxID=2636909 RepID=UPI0008906AE3|nr:MULTISPECIES: chain length determinant protein tyrosine kinase EpsG [unclassified Duganella]SDH35876.1 chain length determinant protein tyrosine kinase EpsG [Duganella sp. OV458]SDK52296.1 chain length determinant protein tyrosine kinase EpsG [Duganella sp. OV510]
MTQVTPSLSIKPSASAPDSSMGRILLDMGKLKPEDGERILRLQKEQGLRFGEAAQRLGLVTAADIEMVLARQFDYPYLQRGQGNFADELVAAYAPFSPQVEMLRAVRSQLMLRWFNGERKALAVLAVNPGEGASLFAANLAVVFSQLGEQTLLVDANLRQPRQSQIFSLDTKQGLSDILVGRADLDVIAKVPSFVDLSVLPCGTLPPNPQELLSRSTFLQVNLEVSNRYDVVLYDVAAFSSGADALAIAARLGGVLLVVRQNSTALDDIAVVSEQLGRVGAEVVGTVLVDY